MHDLPRSQSSSAALWAPLVRFIALEERIGQRAERHAATAYTYEFLRFGLKRLVHRRMPMLVACFLHASFVWFAENIGTFTRTWQYPQQLAGWSMVPFAKLGSWFLLLIISMRW